MLQLKAEVEIRLFNVFFWERKRDSGFRRKKCGMRDFREKGAEMRDQDPHPPLPDPLLRLVFTSDGVGVIRELMT